MNIMKDGVMSFEGVKVYHLPQGFKVQGRLDLTGSEILDLPENLQVSEDLILNENIDHIPKGLFVGGNLIISNSSVKIIPRDAVIAGMVYGDVKYLQKTYKPNTEYHKMVCCDDGTLVPFTKKILQKRVIFTPYYHDRGPITFYLGLKPNLSAAVWKDKIFACKNFSEGEEMVERYILSQKNFSKYKDWNVDTKRTVEELKQFFIFTTNACEQGCDDFIQNYVDTSKLYSLRELKILLDKAKYKYNYLFIEKFNELNQNNAISNNILLN